MGKQNKLILIIACIGLIVLSIYQIFIVKEYTFVITIIIIAVCLLAVSKFQKKRTNSEQQKDISDDKLKNKKSKDKMFSIGCAIIASLLLIVGVGLVVYCYNWNHNVYEAMLDSEFTAKMVEGESEIQHGFSYGYYDAALIGTPICTVLAVAVLAFSAKKKKEAERAAEEERARKKAFDKEHPYYEAEKFYLSCRDAGVKEIESSAGLARLRLYISSNSLQLSEKEAIDCYLLGKSETDRLECEQKQTEKADRLRQLDAEETEYEYMSTRYVGLFGQAKKIRMCLDEAEKARNIVDDLERQYYETQNRGKTIYRAGEQREGDWAVAGGIASGIAGGAAGLAVATDIQRKNTEIRAQNENLHNAVNTLTAHILFDILQKKGDAIEKLHEWEERAEKAKLLLVQEQPAYELLERVAPTLVDLKQSETGAIYIKAEINPAFGKVYDNVDAVVDGFIKAVLWDGEERTGEAILTLPYNGAQERYKTIDGICRSTKLKVGGKYKITFEPLHLWMIET